MAYYRRRRRNWLSLFSTRRAPSWPKMGGLHWRVSQETQEGIFIIFLFVLAALSVLGIFDLSGTFGRGVNQLLSWALGSFKLLFPVLCLVFGYFLLRKNKYQVKIINYLGALVLVLGLSGAWHLRVEPVNAWAVAQAGEGGGYLGTLVAVSLFRLMGLWGALVVCLALIFIGALLTFETTIYGLMWPVKLLRWLGVWLMKVQAAMRGKLALYRAKREVDGYEEESVDNEAETVEAEAKESEASLPHFNKSAVGAADSDDEEMSRIAKPKRFGKKIELPLELLTSRSTKPTSGDIKNNQEIIRRTLANFGIPVEMAEVNIGPTVTQFTFRPADGVKLSKIITLNSDLALALAAHPIRIEAPIPGRSLVGVEVPNELAARVTMGEILSSKEFKSRENNMAIAMGKDVSGRPYFADLTHLPHLMIAGATGSGKSVCINSLIVSLLYQNSPDDLKFILVDPKRMELPAYNGIPYLLTPVITDVKKTINALKWTVVEMERRFEIISRSGRRSIAAYNQGASEKLPYIVFIIDELADLMATAASDVEAGIVRLAQMSRAVGIHLVLATQRPSVEVITGLIKANIPGRIAFFVFSLVDSRTILDCSGAEKLVGRGDMLYLGPEIAKPKRLQGVFLADKEIKNVVDYIKNQGEASYVPGLVEKNMGGFGASPGGGFNDDGDALLGDALDTIRQSGKASASLLQRRLKVGYARAARLLDIMEEQGHIGPSDGAKPREVFLDKIGGVGAVEFAAREYDLEGELRPLTDEETTDPSFTAFTRDQDESDLAAASEAAEEEIEEVEEAINEAVESEVEEIIAAEEEDNETEFVSDEEKPIPTRNKKVFDEDEWT